MPLLGFAAFVVYSIVFVAPHGPNAYGPGVNIGWPPRLAFFTYKIWVVTTDNQHPSEDHARAASASLAERQRARYL